ncbi:Protein FRIGIDA [Linum grandiflorum]
MAKTVVSNAGSPIQSTDAQVKLESVSESELQFQSQPPMTHVNSDPPKVNELPHRSPMVESVNRLCNLSTAIQEFKLRYDELEKHLNFIQSCVETQEQLGSRDVECELHIICETMCARSLRKYITSHLDEAQKLREEVPLALKTAPHPAKLVLECIGRFYLQGSRAFSKDSPMISAREASILALELLLITIEDGEVQLDDLDRQETVQAALNWRKRLVLEGGIRKASEIDAKGLLLFVACYGIPKLFKDEDIWDLVLAANAGQVANALKRSTSLVSRVADIIEQAVSSGLKQNAKLEAVDVASTFGIDDKFPAQMLLNAFLEESKATLKKRKREAHNSPAQLKQANECHLTALKSLMNLLKERNLDPLKVVPGLKFAEEIGMLEKENADLSRTILGMARMKMKAVENDNLDKINPAIKRPRVVGQIPNLMSSPSIGLYEHKAPGYMTDSRSPHSSSFLPGVLSSYVGDTYPPCAPLTSYSSAGGLLHENTHDASVMFRGGLAGSSVGWEGKHNARNRTYGMFGPSPLMEGFPGLTNSPPPVRGATINAADLFRFVDSVVESDYKL